MATKKPTMIPDFPTVAQANEWMCGPAVMHAILNFYGKFVFQRELASMLKTNSRYGTDLIDMYRVFKEMGFRIKRGPFTITQVKRLIEKNIPVILEIQAWAEREVNYANNDVNGHFVIAIGYDSRGIIFEDPYIFHKGHIEYADLEKRWHCLYDNQSKVGSRLGIAVSGKSPATEFSKIVPIR